MDPPAVLESAASAPARLAALKRIKQQIVDLLPTDSHDAAQIQAVRALFPALHKLVKDAHPKVCENALQCLEAGVRCSHSPSVAGSIRWRVVVTRFGDAKAAIREACSALLASCIVVLSWSAVLGKLHQLDVWNAKNFRTRITLLETLIRVVGTSVDGFDIEDFVGGPLTLCISDSNPGVREKAIDLFAVMFEHLGPGVRTAIENAGIRPAQRSAVLERIDALASSSSASEGDAIADRHHTPGLTRARTMGSSESAVVLHATMPSVVTNLNETGERWELAIDALEKLRAAVQDADDRAELSEWLLKAQVPLAAQLQNLRSAVSRETCDTIAFCSKTLRGDFGPSATYLLPTLLTQSTITNKIISDAAHACLATIFANTPLDKQSLLQIFKGASSPHAVMRQRCTEFVDALLDSGNAVVGHAFDKCLDEIKKAIASGLLGAHEASRLYSRRAFWSFHARWPNHAEEIKSSLDSRQQQMLAKSKGSIAGASVTLSSGKVQRQKRVVQRSSTVPARGPSDARAAPESRPRKSLQPTRRKRSEAVRPVAESKTDTANVLSLVERASSGDAMEALEGLAELYGALSPGMSSDEWEGVLSAASSALCRSKEIAKAGYEVLRRATREYAECVAVHAGASMLHAVLNSLVRTSDSALQRAGEELLQVLQTLIPIDDLARITFEICVGENGTDVQVGVLEFFAASLWESRSKLSSNWTEATGPNFPALVGFLEFVEEAQTRSNLELFDASITFIKCLDHQHTELLDLVLSQFPLARHSHFVDMLEPHVRVADSLEKRQMLEVTTDMSSAVSPAVEATSPDFGMNAVALTLRGVAAPERLPASGISPEEESDAFSSAETLAHLTIANVLPEEVSDRNTWSALAQRVSVELFQDIGPEAAAAICNLAASACTDDQRTDKERGSAAKTIAAIAQACRGNPGWSEVCATALQAVLSNLISVQSDSLELTAPELFLAAHDALHGSVRALAFDTSLNKLLDVLQASHAPGASVRVAVELLGVAVQAQMRFQDADTTLTDFLVRFAPVASELLASRRSDLRKGVIHFFRDAVLLLGSDQARPFLGILSPTEARLVTVLVSRKLHESSSQQTGQKATDVVLDRENQTANVF
jgi:CLASP N terminal/Centrosomal protein CEP104-like, TOG domain